MKFLIDECLSPELAKLARERGFPESSHVRWLGLVGAKDHMVTDARSMTAMCSSRTTRPTFAASMAARSCMSGWSPSTPHLA
ncbi:DUF5615 family PIN-like protein [Mesorhizobium sp. M1233]